MTRRGDRGDGSGDPKKSPPELVGSAIARFLQAHGHTERVAQVAVLDDWVRAAGPQIAQFSEARSITGDGTLVVAVATNAWMSELSMHEGEFLARLNEGFPAPRVRRIRWQLRADPRRA